MVSGQEFINAHSMQNDKQEETRLLREGSTNDFVKVVTDSCLSEARVPDFNGEKKGMT